MFPSEEWQPILQAISNKYPEFLVWKHLERALAGVGDIDAAVPSELLNQVSDDFLHLIRPAWSPTHVIVCEHVPGKKLHFVISPKFLPAVPEFDLCTQPSRGAAAWAHPKRLAQLAELNGSGIRGIKPAGEALVALVYHGVSFSGKNRMTHEEEVLMARSLVGDFPTVNSANNLLVPKLAQWSIRSIISKLGKGQWSPVHSRLAWVAFMLSSSLNPGFASRRVLFRLRIRMFGNCIMTRLGQGGRTLTTGDTQEFIELARGQDHQILRF